MSIFSNKKDIEIASLHEELDAYKTEVLALREENKKLKEALRSEPEAARMEYRALLRLQAQWDPVNSVIVYSKRKRGGVASFDKNLTFIEFLDKYVSEKPKNQAFTLYFGEELKPVCRKQTNERYIVSFVEIKD